jgi:hypothetical protein
MTTIKLRKVQTAIEMVEDLKKAIVLNEYDLETDFQTKTDRQHVLRVTLIRTLEYVCKEVSEYIDEMAA